MEIRAAVVREAKEPFVLETLQLDEPKGDEVLVRIVGTGMCHTDLIARDQYFPAPLPIVLGHEGAGVVEKVGAGVSKVQPGDHVVLSFNHCLECRNCKSGKPAYCLNFAPLNFGGGTREEGDPALTTSAGEAVNAGFFGQSSFGSYALANERNVVKVAQDAPLEKLGALGCGVQTGAGAVMNSLAVRYGSSVAVFGAGTVGLSAVMAAHIVGATTIIAVDRVPKRLELARELGATHTVNATEQDAAQAITELVEGGVDYSLETTGVPAVLEQAIKVLGMPGVCGVVGAPPQGSTATFDINHVLFGRSVKGIIEGDSVPDVFIPKLIELYQQGRFPFDKLLKEYALEDINEAARASEEGEVLKPVLVP